MGDHIKRCTSVHLHFFHYPGSRVYPHPSYILTTLATWGWFRGRGGIRNHQPSMHGSVSGHVHVHPCMLIRRVIENSSVAWPLLYRVGSSCLYQTTFPSFSSDWEASQATCKMWPSQLQPIACHRSIVAMLVRYQILPRICKMEQKEWNY